MTTDTVKMLNFHSMHSGVAERVWAPEIKRPEFKSHLHPLLYPLLFIGAATFLSVKKKKKKNSNRPLCKDAFSAKIAVSLNIIMAVKGADPVSIQLYTLLFLPP